MQNVSFLTAFFFFFVVNSSVLSLPVLLDAATLRLFKWGEGSYGKRCRLFTYCYVAVIWDKRHLSRLVGGVICGHLYNVTFMYWICIQI